MSPSGRSAGCGPTRSPPVVRRRSAALGAPTGSNGQNWEFVVVTDRDQGERPIPPGVVPLRRAGERVRATTPDGGSRSVRWQVEHFTDIPVLVVACLRGGSRSLRADAGRRRQLALRLDLPGVRTCCSRPAVGPAPRSSRCPCGRWRWPGASSGCHCRSSPAASCPRLADRPLRRQGPPPGRRGGPPRALRDGATAD